MQQRERGEDGERQKGAHLESAEGTASLLPVLVLLGPQFFKSVPRIS